MPWRHLARALLVPACCCLINLILIALASARGGNWGLAWQGVAPVATLLALACALPFVALPAGLAAIIWIGRRAQSGRIDIFTGCRDTHRLAVGLAVLVGGVLWTAYPATIALWFHIPQLSIVVAVMAATSLGFVVVSAMAVDGIEHEQSELRMRGRAMPSEGAPGLRGLIQSIARSVGSRPVPHVVLGFDPGIGFTPRDVRLDDEVLEGGTLYVSLPMCRTLDRGELAGLVAFEMVHAEVYGAAWQQFIRRARARTSRLLAGWPGGWLMGAALAAARMPLVIWTEMWAVLDLVIWHHAAQRAAVVAGRETVASALGKQLMYPPVWAPFFSDLRNKVRTEAGQLSGDENVSRLLADRCAKLRDEPDFLRPFDSMEAMSQAQPALGAVISGLGVEPADVGRRMRAPPADPAIDLIDGAADVERELSVEAVQSLRPEWPTTPPASPHAAAGVEPTLHATAGKEQTIRREVPADADRPPMFARPRERWTFEGMLVGGLALVLVLFSVWMFAEPLVQLAFPELGATKRGPRGFPVRLHFEPDSLAVTNGSTEAWTCRAEIGYPHVTRGYDVTFVLEPQQTRRVSYAEFRGSDTVVNVATLGRVARSMGGLECMEPSGVVHSMGW
jgi:hypothetical protein